MLFCVIDFVRDCSVLSIRYVRFVSFRYVRSCDICVKVSEFLSDVIMNLCSRLAL